MYMSKESMNLNGTKSLVVSKADIVISHVTLIKLGNVSKLLIEVLLSWYENTRIINFRSSPTFILVLNVS